MNDIQRQIQMLSLNCYIVMTIIHLYMINTIIALWHIVLINNDLHVSSRRPFSISIWSNQISGHKLTNQNEFLIESTRGITQEQSEMRSSKSCYEDNNLLFSTNFQCFISLYLIFRDPGDHFCKLIKISSSPVVSDGMDTNQNDDYRPYMSISFIMRSNN